MRHRLDDDSMTAELREKIFHDMTVMHIMLYMLWRTVLLLVRFFLG